MKTLIAASAAIALFTVPVYAADTNPDANGAGGKPSTSTTSSSNPAAQNDKAYDSSTSGASSGSSGTSKEMPGAADSKKPDSSLSTNGNKMKQ